jgi:hypothetical protein
MPILLKMGLPKPKWTLAESPDVDYSAFKTGAKMTGPLVQGTGEVEGLADLFLPRRLVLRNEKRGSKSLFDSGGIPQSLKIWQPMVVKRETSSTWGISKNSGEKSDGDI